MSDIQPADASALAKKLVAVRSALGYIKKSGYNESQRYNFVTDADVSDTIREELNKAGIATTVGTDSVETVPFTTAKGSPQFLVTVQGTVTFIDQDTGAATSVPAAGQGADSTDKGIYKAMTGMLKYALLKTFLVPTGDDPEVDDERPTKSGGSTAGTTKADPRESEGASSGTSLNAKQRGLLFARVKEKGLNAAQGTAFLISQGYHASSQIKTSEQLDGVLKALDNDTLIAQIKAEVE